MKCTNRGCRLSQNLKGEVTIDGRGEYSVNGISLFYLPTLVPYEA